jgi:hypothetical protein
MYPPIKEVSTDSIRLTLLHKVIFFTKFTKSLLKFLDKLKVVVILAFFILQCSLYFTKNISTILGINISLPLKTNKLKKR